jgi:hypothetical protein
VEGLSNILAAGFKGEQLTALVDQLAGASIKFKDTLKFEGIADGLQETLATGAAIGPFAELLDRSGIALDGFNAGLKEAIKNGTQQQYVLDVLAREGLADVYNEYVKNNGAMVENANAAYDLEKAMKELGDTLLPIITQLTEALSTLVNWFNNLPKGMQDTIVNFGLVIAAIGPLLFAFSQLLAVINGLALAFGTGGALAGVGPAVGGAASAAAGGLAAALAGISAPIWGIIAVIAALVAIIGVLIAHWDDVIAALARFGAFCKTTYDTLMKYLKDKWNKDIEFWTKTFDTVVKTLQERVDLIKGIFTKLKEAVSKLWTDMWQGVFDKFQAVINGIVVATAVFVDFMAKRWEAFYLFIIELWQGITGVIKGFVNDMLMFVNLLIDAINSIQIEIPEWVPIYGGEEYKPNLKHVELLKEDQTLGRGDSKQTVEVTGKVTFEGVNDIGELTGIVDMVWDDILEKFEMEVRS